MHLADAFLQSDLHCIQAIHLYCQYVCSLGIEPTTFALLTQCSNHWATGTLRNGYLIANYIYHHVIIWDWKNQPQKILNIRIKLNIILIQGFPKWGSWTPGGFWGNPRRFVSWHRVFLWEYTISKLIIIIIQMFLQINVTGLYNCHVNVKS